MDPDVATSGQPYAFTGDDPLNTTDPLGLLGCSSLGWLGLSGACHKAVKAIKHTWHKLANVVHKHGWNYAISEAASFVPYTAYYLSYYALKDTHNPVLYALTLPIRPALIGIESAGLAGDAAIDEYKTLTGASNEGINDEGFKGPLFGDQTGLGGPNVYLPGIHRDWSIDFAF